jgi:hypothetical protein
MDLNGDPKPTRSWLLTIVLLIVIIGLFAVIAIPNFNHGGPGKFNGIVNRLRQIDAAKEEWAIEHGVTNTIPTHTLLTIKDLSSYLLPSYTRHEFGDPKFGEIYMIRDLGQPAEAILTREFDEGHGSPFSLPRGAVIRLDATMRGHDCEIILPDGTVRNFP